MACGSAGGGVAGIGEPGGVDSGFIVGLGDGMGAALPAGVGEEVGLARAALDSASSSSFFSSAKIGLCCAVSMYSFAASS